MAVTYLLQVCHGPWRGVLASLLCEAVLALDQSVVERVSRFFARGAG